MSINEGSLDRLLRVIVGVVLLLLTPTIGGLVGNPFGFVTSWGWIGIIPLVTGLVGWCPLYTLLGVNTCSRKT